MDDSRIVYAIPVLLLIVGLAVFVIWAWIVIVRGWIKDARNRILRTEWEEREEELQEKEQTRRAWIMHLGTDEEKALLHLETQNEPLRQKNDVK